MTSLFHPIKIRDIEFKNRIAVSPMCQYSSIDGFANNWHLVHLGSRAVGGAAIVIAEATAITANGRITPHDLGIWKDDHILKLREIAQFISQQNCIPAIQLAHAGRKASHHRPWDGGKALTPQEGAWQTVAPSAIAFSEEDPTPKALSLEEIKSYVQHFSTAALRALEAEMKVIEIHAAHGYLIHEFLSPLSNHRTDDYGGSFENRIRFLLEIITAVRKVWPLHLPLFVRISATDWTEKGWNSDDSVALAKILKTMEVDLMDCSSGGILPNIHIPVEPGYQVPLAKKVKIDADIKTAAVGWITEAKQAEEIISTSKADFVFMAREMLRDPYFPLHAAHILNTELHWPSQYERAKPKKHITS